jgi:3-oxoadipate enol-lactonase
MPYFKSGDIDIYFEASAPEGQPRLLYISGTGADLRKKPGIFDSALPRLFQLASHDQRGLGRSGKPDRPYSMADYADDALRLLDHLGWDKAQVLGVSFGGMVAQELAINHCDRIDRLVLACTSSGGNGGSSYPLHELDSLHEVERAQKMVGISDLRCDQEWINNNPKSYADIIKETLAASHFAADEHNHAIGAKRQLDARIDHDTYDRLHEIQCPTLVCGGKYDGLATPDNLKALAEKLPESELEFFEGGHMFLLQDGKAFPRIVEYLLDS